MDRSILVLQWHARLLAMALMAGMLLAFSGVAWAATALSDPSDPIPQTNGRVTAIALSGNMIYLGGSFTEVITPEGVAVSRSRLAAINADTGEVTDWAPHVSRPVSALAVDGTRLYAGGSFTRAGGKVHNHVAKIDAITGAVDHSWNAGADLPVRALVASGTRLYLGGEFGVVNGAVRSRLALVDAITGALDQNWAPAANGTVRTLALSPDGGRLYAGGEFTTISGKTRRNLAALVASTGALDPTWPRDTSYSVYDVEALGRHVYVAGGGAGGNAAAFDASTGAPLWQLQGDGDFQAVAYLDGQVYFGGHFRVLDDGTGRVRLLSVAADTGSVSGWQPKANRGVWAVGADVLRTRIYTGGDFTKISDQPREGFAQFSVVPSLPDTTAPDTTINSGPSGYVRSASASFSFSSEPGSTFECSRDGSAIAVCTSPKSYTSLSQGNHTFRVKATDAAGNTDTTPASRSWFVDTVVPKGTISINGGAASTASRYVTLKLSASDPSPASGVAYMRLRNGGTTTWSRWFAYATNKSWTLTTGAGTKTVYVQYKDRTGNISAAASDTIRFSP